MRSVAHKLKQEIKVAKILKKRRGDRLQGGEKIAMKIKGNKFLFFQEKKPTQNKTKKPRTKLKHIKSPNTSGKQHRLKKK